MSLLVTGSIGIDTVDTPAGRAQNVLGGSAIYFSMAASLFTPVRLVGAVGEDFDAGLLAPLRERHIDLAGLETRKGSQTFRWHGRYAGLMNEAETVDVKLNVLAERGAPIPDKFCDSRFVFLANTHPTLQRSFADQLPRADLVVCDTMNLWIENESAELRRTLARVNGVVLNEGEARLLTKQNHLVTAGQTILGFGPKFVVIKKGDNGSILVAHDDLFIMPAYPTTKIIDPTGCGDSFAGALMGYIAAAGKLDKNVMRSAMARGTAVASCVIEEFSVSAIANVTIEEVNRRVEELHHLVRFEY